MILRLFLFLTWMSGSQAFAFPEFARNGYTRCLTCHVSPNGGGMLNEYGREIIPEKLAIWKTDSEEPTEHYFLYGALRETSVADWLRGGGDVRTVYYYQDDASQQLARTIFMQADLELGVQWNQVMFVGSVGAQQPPGQNVEFMGRKYFAQFFPDDHWVFRAGKFIPSYGLLGPEHTALTKDPLRLGYRYENYALEANYFTERWSLTGSFLLGRQVSARTQLDRGGVLRATFSLSERFQIGANAWWGKTDAANRLLFGVFGLAGLTEEWFVSSEIDFQNQTWVQVGTPLKGWVSTQKVSFEAGSGIWIYGLQEWGKYHFMNPRTQAETYGLGIQLFPRAHFEFNLLVQKIRNRSFQSDFYDFVSLLSHFYF